MRHRQNWGVYFFDHEGHLASLEGSWTDGDPPEPFVAITGAKAVARFVDLLELVKLIDELAAKKC